VEEIVEGIKSNSWRWTWLVRKKRGVVCIMSDFQTRFVVLIIE
jgi:hypothetical protein